MAKRKRLVGPLGGSITDDKVATSPQSLHLRLQELDKRIKADLEALRRIADHEQSNTR